VPQWLDDLAAEVFVDDGSVDVGDLRSFGEAVDHDGVGGVGIGYGDVLHANRRTVDKTLDKLRPTPGSERSSERERTSKVAIVATLTDDSRSPPNFASILSRAPPVRAALVEAAVNEAAAVVPPRRWCAASGRLRPASSRVAVRASSSSPPSAA